MTRLSHSQWDHLNRFCLELHSECSQEHFFHSCLEKLPEVLGVRWVGWNEMDEDYKFVGFRVTDAYQADVEMHAESMEHTIATNPLIEGLGLQHREGPMDGVHVGTDFVPEAEMKERAIYREAYRHVGILHQMYTEMNFTPGVRSSLTLNSNRPIGEDQRLMLQMTKAHLVVSFRNLLRREGPAPFFSPRDRRATFLEKLSPRLQEALGHLLNGLPRKWIAEEMEISLHTVNDYIREIYARLDVHSHAELIAKISTNGGWALRPSAQARPTAEPEDK